MLTNSISDLQKIMVKPHAWRLLQDAEGAFRLLFTYVDPSRDEWAQIQTARGQTKIYKTESAALRDVARVQLEAVVYFHALPV